MKTIELKVFKFQELSTEAKERAIEEIRQERYEFGEPLSFFHDDCIEFAEKKGFIEPRLQYSLSYSQGDGLSFEANGFELERLKDLFLNQLGVGKEKTALLLAKNCYISIEGNTGHYCFARRSDIDMYIQNYSSSINCTNIDNIDEVCKRTLSDLQNIYIDVCNELEEVGYAEIEYYYSDEATINYIEANELEFLESGKQY